MKSDKLVRLIKYEDFNQLGNLPPEDWDFNYTDFLAKHIQEKYFYGIVTLSGSEITGTGNAFDFGNTGWLANIIVKPEHRRHGIGLFITQHLTRYLKMSGCKTLFLLATESGKSIYQKSGFISILNYRYFTSEHDTSFALPKNIRKARESDLEEIIKLDAQATGEDRSHLILKSYKSGWICSSGSAISGFYLQDFGRGVVIALNKETGLTLLELKHSIQKSRSAVPETNHDTIRFFEENSIKETSICTRMMQGLQIQWNPDNIYSYAAGYCG